MRKTKTKSCVYCKKTIFSSRTSCSACHKILHTGCVSRFCSSNKAQACCLRIFSAELGDRQANAVLPRVGIQSTVRASIIDATRGFNPDCSFLFTCSLLSHTSQLSPPCTNMSFFNTSAHLQLAGVLHSAQTQSALNSSQMLNNFSNAQPYINSSNLNNSSSVNQMSTMQNAQLLQNWSHLYILSKIPCYLIC